VRLGFGDRVRRPITALAGPTHRSRASCGGLAQVPSACPGPATAAITQRAACCYFRRRAGSAAATSHAVTLSRPTWLLCCPLQPPILVAASSSTTSAAHAAVGTCSRRGGSQPAGVSQDGALSPPSSRLPLSGPFPHRSRGPRATTPRHRFDVGDAWRCDLPTAHRPATCANVKHLSLLGPPSCRAPCPIPPRPGLASLCCRSLGPSMSSPRCSPNGWACCSLKVCTRRFVIPARSSRLAPC
jgi:hypothetical protein